MVYRIYVEKKPGLDQEARAIEMTCGSCWNWKASAVCVF